MNDINTFYYNDFGIAFQWKRCAAKDFKKIQLVFRNTGLLLTAEELIRFSSNIDKSLMSIPRCQNCRNNRTCKSILLEAPNPQTSFAVSIEELEYLKDLVKGTIFQLGLHKILKKQFIDYY